MRQVQLGLARRLRPISISLALLLILTTSSILSAHTVSEILTGSMTLQDHLALGRLWSLSSSTSNGLLYSRVYEI